MKSQWEMQSYNRQAILHGKPHTCGDKKLHGLRPLIKNLLYKIKINKFT